MEQALLLLVLSEAIAENIKWVIEGIKEKTWELDRIIAFVVSVLICVLAGFDLFSVVGWELMFPYVGSVLTGIAVSRGANILHDLYKLPSLVSNGKS